MTTAVGFQSRPRHPLLTLTHTHVCIECFVTTQHGRQVRMSQVRVADKAVALRAVVGAHERRQLVFVGFLLLEQSRVALLGHGPQRRHKRRLRKTFFSKNVQTATFSVSHLGVDEPLAKRLLLNVITLLLFTGRVTHRWQCRRGSARDRAPSPRRSSGRSERARPTSCADPSWFSPAQPAPGRRRRPE